MGAAGLAHDLGLLVGWWAALAAWLGLARLLAGRRIDLWPEPGPPEIDRPWRSLVWVLVGLAATLGLSRLHAHGFMLVVPGVAGAIAAAVEQLVIFAPVLLVPYWLDEREKALPYFEKALELDPNHYYTRLMLGWHYFQAEDFVAAREWNRKSLQVNWATNPQGHAYYDLINRAAAEQAVKKQP